jgi:uncharacterized protein with PIN domain
MALIVCPECNQQVSSAAEACPHCGFPIANHLKEQEQNSYHQKLLSQVAMFPLSSPQPRARVCAKCAEPYFYNTNFANNDTPMCECNAPTVEIDISQEEMSGRGGVASADADIFERLIFPRNIGDKSSQEYKARINDIYKRLNLSLSERGEPPHEPPAPIKDLVDRSQWKPQSSISHTHVSAPLRPTCPYCHSASLTKISKSGTFLKIAALGLFGASDIGKTWKCNNCGSKF